VRSTSHPSNMSSSWRDDLIPIIGSYNAEGVFPLTNVILPAWLLLFFAPKWKYTHTIAWVPIFLNAAMYLITLVSIIQGNRFNGSFNSLDGIVELFSDPNVVFVGWIHYLSFDLFVARAISLDALQHTISYVQYVVLIAPCLFLCLMAGPVGLLLYALVKVIFLRPKTKEKDA
jgi:Domain of unknown function (DUF4281)